MNSTICLTTTLLVTRVVVGGWWLEEEPRIIDPDTRTGTILSSFSLLNWVPLDCKQLNRIPQVTGNSSIHCRPPNSLRHNSESPDCRVRGTGNATRVTLMSQKPNPSEQRFWISFTKSNNKTNTTPKAWSWTNNNNLTTAQRDFIHSLEVSLTF